MCACPISRIHMCSYQKHRCAWEHVCGKTCVGVGERGGSYKFCVFPLNCYVQKCFPFFCLIFYFCVLNCAVVFLLYSRDSESESEREQARASKQERESERERAREPESER